MKNLSSSSHFLIESVEGWWLQTSDASGRMQLNWVGVINDTADGIMLWCVRHSVQYVPLAAQHQAARAAKAQ